MPLRVLRPICLLLLFCCATLAASAQAVSVPLDPAKWAISEKNERLNPNQSGADNGEAVEYLGRRALRLAKAFAYVPGLDLRNGTMDADVAFAPNAYFVGIAFRVQSDDAYEMVFLRNGSQGDLQAIQYTPGLLGMNAWKIYNVPHYAGRGDFPSDKWFHMRIVFASTMAKFFLNNQPEPSLVIPDLKQGYSTGSIGLWGQNGGGYFSNVTYTRDDANYSPEIKQDFLPGALTDWELSDAYDAADVDAGVYPAAPLNLKWEKVTAENPGLVVIQRYRRDPNVIPPRSAAKPWGRVPGSKMVFARTTIHSDRDEIRKMYFGYSAEAVVYLNSKPLYAGNNAYTYREPGFLGLMDVNNDAVYLALKKGDNELMLAVTEFFGGWGFICRLEP